MPMKRFFSGPIIGLGVVIVLWAALSSFRPEIIPPPLSTFALFFVLLPGALLAHAGTTMLRAVTAIVVTSIIAVPLGIAAGRCRLIDRVLSPVSYLLYPIPKVALLPVVMLLFGLGNQAKVILLILVLFFQMMLAIRDAAANIPDQYFTTIEVLGGGPLAKLRYVIIPAGLPRYITALRVGTGTALAALFFSETFATHYGLGFFIMDSWMRINYPEMFAGIIAMGVVGGIMFALIDLAEYLLIPWNRQK